MRAKRCLREAIVVNWVLAVLAVAKNDCFVLAERAARQAPVVVAEDVCYVVVQGYLGTRSNKIFVFCLYQPQSINKPFQKRLFLRRRQLFVISAEKHLLRIDFAVDKLFNNLVKVVHLLFSERSLEWQKLVRCESICLVIHIVIFKSVIRFPI